MIGKRELRKANNRINLSKAMENALKKNRYEDIKLMDLCKWVGISKVTFFKYYTSKAELLRYVFRIYCLEIGQELKISPKKGLAGLYFVFDWVIQKMNKNPHFFYAYYSYLVSDTRIRAPFKIGKPERMLLGEDFLDVEIRSIAQLIDSFILEAVFAKEIEIRDPKEISAIINSLMVGIIVESSMTNTQPAFMSVSHKLQMFLKPYQMK